MNQSSRYPWFFLGCLLLLGWIFAVWADRAAAWGGHDVVMQAVVERLPEGFRAKLSDEAVRKAIGPWCGIIPTASRPSMPRPS